MLHKPWTINKTQTHIAPQTQVVVKPFGVSMATTAACLCGVSLFNPYIPADKAGGQNNKSLRGIPLVSPGLHNPVKRNGQQRRELCRDICRKLVHGVTGEIGCKIGNVG